MYTPVYTTMNAPVAHGSWPIRYLTLVVQVWCNIALGACVSRLFLVVIVALPGFGVATSHAHIPPYADTAALISDHLAKLRAFGQARELLGAEDMEGFRSDFKPEVDMCFWSHRTERHLLSCSAGCWRCDVLILGLLDFFVEIEVQPVFALMAYGQVREDEVAGGVRSIEVGDTSDRHTSQDGHRLRDGVKTGLGDWTCGFQCGEEEEIGVVRVGDVLFLLAFENAQLNDRWWIYWTPIR